MTLTGYHQRAHFRCNDLVVYFRMDAPEGVDDCPHIDDLKCSRARELAPDKCRTERRCELLEWKDRLFRDLGIHGPTLLELDRVLRGQS